MKIKKIVAGILATALVGSLAIPTNATQTVEYDSTVNDSTSSYSDVTVQAERAELYTVTLPKVISLTVEDTTASSTYDVSVTGEIGENNYVRVIPLEGATLTNAESGSELPLDVVQAKRRFAWNELDLTVAATTQGTYTAENMQPGDYSGNVRYLITLDDGAVWTSASCTLPSTRIGRDLNDNGVIDLGEDIDGDGNLDVDEDINCNGVLDTGEDIDGDDNLDVDEDTNGDGVLAISEKDSDLGLNVTRGKSLGHSYPVNRSFECICERCSAVCFAIATPEHLIEFANEVNGGKTYSGATVYLCNDLDLTGYTVPIIGTTWNGLTGTFDGNGYAVHNWKQEVTVSGASSKETALFGALSGTVKNLTLINPVVTVTANAVTSKQAVGILYAKEGNGKDASIDNVHIYNGIITVTGTASDTGVDVGMITGYNNGNEVTITNCSTTGAVNILATGFRYSNIAGFLNNINCDTIVKNCMSSVNIVNNSSGTVSTFITGPGTVGTLNVKNCVFDTTYGSCSYGTGMTTNQMKSQSALDVLNTDNELTWKLDMEGLNNGYPIIA